jgi:hypothetical protein
VAAFLFLLALHFPVKHSMDADCLIRAVEEHCSRQQCFEELLYAVPTNIWQVSQLEILLQRVNWKPGNRSNHLHKRGDLYLTTLTN